MVGTIDSHRLEFSLFRFSFYFSCSFAHSTALSIMMQWQCIAVEEERCNLPSSSFAQILMKHAEISGKLERQSAKSEEVASVQLTLKMRELDCRFFFSRNANDVIVVGQYPYNLYNLSSSNFRQIVSPDNYGVCVEFTVFKVIHMCVEDTWNE